jgi:hypothetical protein
MLLCGIEADRARQALSGELSRQIDRLIRKETIDVTLVDNIYRVMNCLPIVETGDVPLVLNALREYTRRARRLMR